MPFRSQSQRRFMHARHPDIAKRWEDHTPKGKKLPEHVKDASLLGASLALDRFGLKAAGEELRLKIPNRTFHGWDAAHKDVAKRGHKKLANPYGDRRTSEALAEILSALDIAGAGEQPRASKNPLERDTMWGPPSNLAAGDTGSRVSDMGQITGFEGV